MFPFITCTRNPIGGGAKNGYWCIFNCSYCWANNLKDYRNWSKYHGEFRIFYKEFRRFKKDDFPFICDMIDIGDTRIPFDVLYDLFTWIDNLTCENVLLLTKNPYVYIDYKDIIPKKAVLGATIETDLNMHTSKYSKAPNPKYRLICMEKIRDLLPDNKRFICIEPIMEFTRTFKSDIEKIEPWSVAVGYDNYHNELPEPTKDKTLSLINQLEKFTIVFRKTIRKKWGLY